MSVIKTEGRIKMTEPEYQIVAQVGEVHSVSAKMTPFARLLLSSCSYNMATVCSRIREIKMGEQ